MKTRDVTEDDMQLANMEFENLAMDMWNDMPMEERRTLADHYNKIEKEKKTGLAPFEMFVLHLKAKFFSKFNVIPEHYFILSRIQVQ